MLCCAGTETLGPLHYYTKPGAPPFNSPQQMAQFAVAGLAVKDAASLLHRLGSQSFAGAYLSVQAGRLS